MHTVISAFDDRAQAHRAMERLIERGFSRDRVHLESGREPSITGAGRDAADSDDGFLEGIRRFFSDLFGGDEQHSAHASHYAEAVRRGSSVLVVDAADQEEAERARDAMEAMGGTVDMDERTTSWRSEDWTKGGPTSGRADNLTDDDAWARTDTNTRDDTLTGALAGREAAMGGSGTLAGTDASTRLESDTGTLPGTDTNTRLDLDLDVGRSAQADPAPLTSSPSAGAGASGPGRREAVMPLVQEEVQVGEREASRGGVRVFQRVTETPVREMVRLREERAVTERRPVDRPATQADPAQFREGSIEIRENADKAVVAKTARVVEEVVVRRDVQERSESIEDTVRRTDVEVEPLPGAGRDAGTRSAATRLDSERTGADALRPSSPEDDEAASRTR